MSCTPNAKRLMTFFPDLQWYHQPFIQHFMQSNFKIQMKSLKQNWSRSSLNVLISQNQFGQNKTKRSQSLIQTLQIINIDIHWFPKMIFGNSQHETTKGRQSKQQTSKTCNAPVKCARKRTPLTLDGYLMKHIWFVTQPGLSLPQCHVTTLLHPTCALHQLWPIWITMHGKQHAIKNMMDQMD